MSALSAQSQPYSPSTRTTYLWLSAMVLLWGFSWPTMKLALASVPPLWMATLRFGTGGLCLFALLAVQRKLRLPARGDWPIVFSVGGLQMMAFTGLGLKGMQYVDASHAALLAYTTPLWGVLAAWAMFGQRPIGHQLIALLIGLSGIVLICSPWEMDWHQRGALLGSLLLIAGAMCWSFVILHIRRHRWIGRPIDLAPWQMLVATVPLAFFARSFEGPISQIEWTPTLTLLVAYIGPVATSACFVISTEYGRRITAFTMSNLILGVPVIGVLSSAWILGNHLSGTFAVGLLLIIGGAGAAALASRSSNRIPLVSGANQNEINNPDSAIKKKKPSAMFVPHHLTKFGNTNTPNIEPIRLNPVANPAAPARISVGNNSVG